MLILTDTHPGSLLQVAEHLKGHELMRTEKYVHENGMVTEVDLNFVDVDVQMAIEKGTEVFDEAIQRFLKTCILPEVVIATSQIPPWQRKSTDNYLSKLTAALETLASEDAEINSGVSVTWYAPPNLTTIKKLAKKHSTFITLRENTIYKKVQDQKWRESHNKALALITQGLPLHFIESDPISPQLTALIRQLRDVSEGSSAKPKAEAKLHFTHSLDSLVGNSPAISKTKELLLRVAKSGPGLNVMLIGETGTGKEVAAKILHRYSALKEKPFKSLNCGGLNRELVEAQLFGYVKGAYTGAIKDFDGMVGQIDKEHSTPRNGKAYAGTLFLDELHDLPGSTQGLLLRFLESGEYRRVGDTEDRYAKIRIFAALQPGEEKRKNLRDDLYNRLAEMEILLPTLNERLEDIPWIAQYLLEKFTEEECYFSLPRKEGAVDSNRINDILSTPGFIKKLMAHDWSQGNVRELRNILKRATMLGELEIRKHDFPLSTKAFFLPNTLDDIIPAKDFRDNYMAAVYKKFTFQGVTDTELASKLDCDPRTLKSARGSTAGIEMPVARSMNRAKNRR